METEKALELAMRLWNRIELRRFSSGTDNQLHGPHGIRGALDYYRGLHKLHFASDQFNDYFKDRFRGFTDNWCAPVIDAAAERMNFVGIRLGEGTRDADQDFQRVLEANDAQRGLSETFTVMLAAGRSFALVWGNPDDEQTPRITFEHPEYCITATDPDTGEVTAAAKGWLDDHKGYLTLYTADEIWKWQFSVADDNDARRSENWEPRSGLSDDTWPMKNPMSRVPMVEFRNQTLLDDKPLSDLAGVAAMQDAVNMLWAYLFNGLDFASLPQRLMTGAEPPSMPILDATGQVIGKKAVDLKKYLQERVIWVPNKDATPGSWPAADLAVFSNVIEVAVDHIASQTRTPPHYLMGKMSNTAAESLTVAETGLVAKVVQRTGYAVKSVRDIHALVALAQGDSAKAKQAATGRILWQDPQYRALSQKMDALQKFRQAGVPLEYALEWYGLDPSEVDRVMAMAKKEQDLLFTASPLKLPPGVPMPRGQVDIAAGGTAAAASQVAQSAQSQAA